MQERWWGLKLAVNLGIGGTRNGRRPRGEFVSITAALFEYSHDIPENGTYDAEKLETPSCGSEHQLTMPLAQHY
jgi:hypothetical protein